MDADADAEAMATQFSSLNVVDDRFSELPDHIIHRIFRFLPTIKDVVRTTAISKSCLQAWDTFPISKFELKELFSGSSALSREEQVESKTEQFIRFVDTSMQRFGRQIRDGNGCYEHLNLRISVLMKDIRIRCLIPDSVLSAYWLKSLILSGSTICIPLTEGSRVNLPSLKFLLICCSYIPDEQLHKLLSGCPALQVINLVHCPLLSKIDICDHPNLETLNIHPNLLTLNVISNVPTRLISLRVRAPKLKSLVYNFEGDVVKIDNSPELKSLMIGNRNMTEEFFHKFIAQFPLLKYLTIIYCCALREIKISNPLLEKIIIKNCFNLKDVVISCKKLASFLFFTQDFSILNRIRIEMDNPPNDCTAVIEAIPNTKGECDSLMEASWYCELEEFLRGPCTFKNLDIIVKGLSDVDGDMNEEDVHTKLPPAACNIEKLGLVVTAPSSCHTHILNGLLSACHPTVIQLNVIPDNHFVKLVCEELGKRVNNSKCWCKDDFKCWKHQLKEVKIKRIRGIKLKENLDWDALFDLLPTLEAENNIYFKLMW